jgi:hypothetical protein
MPAVAVMLSFLLLEAGVADVSAVSFASPACLSPELATEAAAFTTVWLS